MEFQRLNIIFFTLSVILICYITEGKQRFQKQHRDFDSREHSDEDRREFHRKVTFKPPTEPPPTTPYKKAKFSKAFLASTSLTITSEFGDRTFLIVSILALSRPKVAIFLGAILACTVMTVLSAGLGVITTFLPQTLVHYISILVYIIFGLLMLKEGWSMSSRDSEEEFEEAEEDVKKQEERMRRDDHKRKIGILSKLVETFLEAFSLNFFGEWGDRSQMTTLVLSTREDYVAVTLGSTLGHAICLVLALIIGRIATQKLSTRTVTLIGGALFLIYAVTSCIFT